MMLRRPSGVPLIRSTRHRRLYRLSGAAGSPVDVQTDEAGGWIAGGRNQPLVGRAVRVNRRQCDDESGAAVLEVDTFADMAADLVAPIPADGPHHRHPPTPQPSQATHSLPPTPVTGHHPSRRGGYRSLSANRSPPSSGAARTQGRVGGSKVGGWPRHLTSR